MFQYRQVLARLRAGDSERDIARTKLMGRQKLAALRALAASHGWLDTALELPDEATIAAALGAGQRARSTISSVEPWREQVAQWQAAGVQGKASTPPSSASTATRAATRRWRACWWPCAGGSRRR
jgi:hypothetical protein